MEGAGALDEAGGPSAEAVDGAFAVVLAFGRGGAGGLVGC